MVRKSVWSVYAPLHSQAMGFLLYRATEVSHCPQKGQFHNDLLPSNHWNSLTRMCTTAAFLWAWHVFRWQTCRTNERPGLVHQAERSRVQASPCLLSFHPPSSAPPPPLLPVSPSGNHEPHGFQAQILRFQMVGKFLCLGHSSRVREFNLGGKTAETLPFTEEKINKVWYISIPLPTQFQTHTQCLISEKILRFPPGREQNGKNKISSPKHILFSLLRYQRNWHQIIGCN